MRLSELGAVRVISFYDAGQQLVKIPGNFFPVRTPFTRQQILHCGLAASGNGEISGCDSIDFVDSVESEIQYSLGEITD